MAKVCWAAKVGVVAPGAVVFSSTDTVLALSLATMRSGLPSPLRSPTVTEMGFGPVAKSLWAAKVTGGPTTLVIPVSCTEKVRLGLLKTPLPKIGMAMVAVARAGGERCRAGRRREVGVRLGRAGHGGVAHRDLRRQVAAARDREVQVDRAARRRLDDAAVGDRESGGRGEARLQGFQVRHNADAPPGDGSGRPHPPIQPASPGTVRHGNPRQTKGASQKAMKVYHFVSSPSRPGCPF